MKAFALVATALLAVLAVGTAAAVTLPSAATDHWADQAATHFPDPDTGSQGRNVTGHPSADMNGVPPGPTSWLNESAPYGPSTWLGDETPRGPPNWVQ